MNKSIEEEFLTEIDDGIKKRKNRKKSINSKQKGNGAERECKNILNKRFKGIASFNRSPMSGAFLGKSNRDRSQSMSEEQQMVFTSDIYCSDVKFKFSIEHKFYKEISFWDLFNDSSDLHSWMAQAQSDADSINKSPMIIAKFNNKKRIVFIHQMPFEPVFIHKGWNCYLLDDLLNLKDSFFFE